jgi:hypothetical protein
MSGKVGSITTGIITDGLVYNLDAANRASTIPSTSTLKTFNTVNPSQFGTIVTDATWEDGSPPSFDFDGSDGEILLGSLFGQNQEVFTVSAWVNFTSNPGYQMILSDNIWFANYTANNIGLDVKNSSGGYYDNSGGLSQGTNFTIPADLRTGTFINVAACYEGNSSGTTAKVRMYLNGGEQVNVTVTYSGGGANCGDSSNFYLGSRNTAQFLNGNIQSFHVYNRALSSTEVLHNYNALKDRFN